MTYVPGTDKTIPRVAIMGLASCFGCQLQIVNAEEHIFDVLGRIDLVKWQLATSASLSDDIDVAIIEGAVTTEEHIHMLESIRESCSCIIAIGSCACTAGIPGIAYDNCVPNSADGLSVIEKRIGRAIEPRPISAVIPVDYELPGCPIDTTEFLNLLQRILRNVPAPNPEGTLCSACRMNESQCFIDKGQLCLGLVTRTGCGARCIKRGRACMGCHGISSSSNIDAAIKAAMARGFSREEFERALLVFNRYELCTKEGE
jgi:sulfhydrogenase subunit delta